MPELYIITGSNGAGKSTLGKDYLPKNVHFKHGIFDADKLVSEKKKEFWHQGLRSIKEINRLADEYVIELFESQLSEVIKNNENFVYEGHFAFEETWQTPRMFKKAGYHINMIFLGLNDVDLSELRVLDRVFFGGHSVSRLNIENNFYGNLETLNKHFDILDTLLIFDTSEISHVLLLEVSDGVILYSIRAVDLPVWFTRYLPSLTKKILDSERLDDNAVK